MAYAVKVPMQVQAVPVQQQQQQVVRTVVQSAPPVQQQQMMRSMVQSAPQFERSMMQTGQRECVRCTARALAFDLIILHRTNPCFVALYLHRTAI